MKIIICLCNCTWLEFSEWAAFIQNLHQHWMEGHLLQSSYIKAMPVSIIMSYISLYFPTHLKTMATTMHTETKTILQIDNPQM